MNFPDRRARQDGITSLSAKKRGRVVWCLGGSDSGGGAGVQADNRALAAFGIHGANILTAVTAQNPDGVRGIRHVDTAMVAAQWDALAESLFPVAIKTGMLGSAETIRLVARRLRALGAPVICDPVLKAQSGADLADPSCLRALKEELLPLATLVTPNLAEGAALTGRTSSDLATPEAVEETAREILSLGAKAVLLKGGHARSSRCSDYFTDGKTAFWLSSPRREQARTHGTGCTLAAAAAAGLAENADVAEAVSRAKLFLNLGLRLAYEVGGAAVLDGAAWPEGLIPSDLPRLEISPEQGPPAPFPPCGPLGFYPIVDSVAWMERLLPQGVRAIQLRDKARTGSSLSREIAAAVALSRRHSCRLFVNDHWRLALEHGAYGVHLGQEDLDAADLLSLRRSGIRLGVSTHSFTELARALAAGPSYVALGPIYPTTAKPMRFAPQGLERLCLWRRLTATPLVAIGGISWENFASVLAMGADGIAVISDVTRATDPEARARRWVKSFSRSG